MPNNSFASYAPLCYNQPAYHSQEPNSRDSKTASYQFPGLLALALLLLPHAGTASPSQNAAAKLVIHYVGGRKPYVLVRPGKFIPYASQDKEELYKTPYTQFSRQTPGGLVSLHWRFGYFLEGGDLVSHPSEISQNASVMSIAIITPDKLPIVLEVEAPDHGWLHVNGYVMSAYAGHSQSLRAGVRRIKLPGGLNLIEAGVFDAE